MFADLSTLIVCFPLIAFGYWGLLVVLDLFTAGDCWRPDCCCLRFDDGFGVCACVIELFGMLGFALIVLVLLLRCDYKLGCVVD